MKAFSMTIALTACVTGTGQETLPPITGDAVPRTFAEMWAGFDPRREPLETETLKEWEEDGVVLRVVRYRIGVFKGKKALMAAVYGFPKGGSKLPGLVQIHGGGQYADYRAPLTNAKRGYATISLAWAGRINAPGYAVNPDIVKLFWKGKTDDPRYRLTTDWGALDAYHAPCRNARNAFPKAAPAPWTLDAVESPRNSPWFLCALAARRALTFLERQPEVDPGSLGVYGHSMGGKLTVMTAAADARVKAAAPSCGGVSDRYNRSALFRATLGDDVSLKHVTCPIIFLNPSNDFHSHSRDLPKAVREIRSKDWRVTSAPHHNHQDTPEYMVCGLLWLDEYLKGTFTFPQTPRVSLDLHTAHGVPVLTVHPDAWERMLSVDVYYTQQGVTTREKPKMEDLITCFWRYAPAKRHGNAWTARLPLLSPDKPLWAYANVTYRLERPVAGASYYYALYAANKFVLSSLIQTATPQQLKVAGVRALLKPSLAIETFRGDWEKEWFTYRPEEWARRTHKVHDEQWKAPPQAKLALEVRSEKPNKMVVGIDEYATEVQIAGNGTWQRVVLAPSDFRNATGETLPGWQGIRELRLSAKETLRSTDRRKRQTAKLGADWQGPKPEFRDLRWMVE